MTSQDRIHWGVPGGPAVAHFMSPRGCTASGITGGGIGRLLTFTDLFSNIPVGDFSGLGYIPGPLPEDSLSGPFNNSPSVENAHASRRSAFHPVLSVTGGVWLPKL